VCPRLQLLKWSLLGTQHTATYKQRANTCSQLSTPDVHEGCTCSKTPSMNHVVEIV
jgi:hypothetical protein